MVHNNSKSYRQTYFNVDIKSFLNCKVVILLLLTFTCFTSTAQVNTYEFQQALVGYTEITGGTEAYAAPWDNHVNGSTHQAPIGFPFFYNGNPIAYTQCFISTNGFITFGVTQPLGTLIVPLSNGTPYEGAVSPMGMDLKSGIGNEPITYRTLGASPNRIFVVQWKNVERQLSTGPLNFQVRLFETSNRIELRYGFCFPDDTDTNNRGAQVGLRGPNNVILQGNINNRLQSGVNNNNTWFNRSVAGTATTHGMRTSATEYPDNGLVYTYTPPVQCSTISAAGAPSNFQIGSSSVTLNSFVGNTFTPSPSPLVRYMLLRSTVSTPPTDAIPQLQDGSAFPANLDTIGGDYLVISNNAVSPFLQTLLSENTTYYYWLIPYNGLCFGAPIYNFTTMISASNSTCISAPTLLPLTALNGNGFTANWNPVAGATDYVVDVSTNSSFTAIVPGYAALSSGGSTSLVITDLPTLTSYFYRVRAVGVGACALNSATSGTGALPCGFYTVPYSQNFDTTIPNNIPSCSDTENTNADGLTWSVQNTNSASIPNSLFINTNPTIAMDDWFFLPGVKLTGGVSYRLFFRYNTANTGGLVERLRVRLGSGPSIAQMGITVLELPSVTNTIYQSTFADFTPVSNGIYYLGFQGFSPANQSYLVIDDISITVAPTCFEPEDVALSVSGITTSTIAFTPPSVVPAQGYDYFLSTTLTVPTVTTTPTGTLPAGSTTFNLTGLTASTQYYIWIRGNCGPGDTSIWSQTLAFSTDCNAPSLTSVTPASRCGIGTVSLSAIPNSGSVTEWFNAPSGGTLVGTGATFVTPILTTNTTYYAQAKAAGAVATLGPLNPNAIAGAKSIYTDASAVNVTVTTATRLIGFDIFPITSGQNGLLVIRNALGVPVSSASFITAAVGGSTPQTIPINYDFIPGNYTVSMVNVPSSGLMSNSENVTYPYSNSVADLTGNNFDNSFYIYFYNWKFTTTCLSPLTPVTATVTSPPSLGLSQGSDTICSGETTATINVIGAGSYNTFTWSPSVGVSGNSSIGYSFNPTETTTYTLTASQTSGSFCSQTTVFIAIVNPSPPALTIVPGDTTLCEGDIQALAATFGASAAVNILNENFEGTPSWTTSNFSVGGNTAAAAWTLRNSPYSFSGGGWTFNANSNDASQFYMTNSAAQGGPGTNVTSVYLESPTFSLVGYSTASLSFWHYLFRITGNKCQTEISIDDGVTWSFLSTHTSTSLGASVFLNPVINLNAYIGNPQMKIRFHYEAFYDYGWAIDNVRVFGTVATAVEWSPVTDLYLDNLATIPYTGTPTGTVYTRPTANRTYTATVATVDGCISQASININFDALPIGGTLSGSEALCGTAIPTSIFLTGNSHPVTRWESADDAAFTINVASIANTSTTLTAAQMGAIPSIKYFRAVISNGVCPVAYTDVVSVAYPSTTWNGTTWTNGTPDNTKRVIFAGNFTSSGDTEACSVEVQAGSIVTIASGNTLTVSNQVTVLGSPATTNLIFQNNASLIQVNPVANSGSIRYIRNANPMVRNDYTYWSSPVANQVLNVFSPLTNPNRYYRFDNATYNWLAVPGASTMAAAVGYIMRAPSNYDPLVPSTFIGEFVGVPHNGNYTFPIVVNTVPNPIEDRNLIGNPYPSSIDADLLLSNNLSTLQGSFYFWTHNTPITNNVYTANDYAVYNQSGGTSASISTGLNNNPPTKFIAAGQAVFVQGLNSGILTFSNAIRVAGNNASFFRSSEQNTIETREKHRIWLNLINNQGAFKQILVGYIQDATNQMDNHYDSEIAEAGNAVSLYTMVADKKLVIQGRALPFSDSDIVPIGFRTVDAGTYAIQLADFDGLFASDLPIYIEDKALNYTHNIRESNYEFVTDSGIVEDRFVLKFTNETLSLPTSSVEDIIVFKNQNNIEILASTNVTLASVKINDIRGRLIATVNNINSHTATVSNLNIANQVLLVQISDADGKIVTKKLIF